MTDPKGHRRRREKRPAPYRPVPQRQRGPLIMVQVVGSNPTWPISNFRDRSLHRKLQAATIGSRGDRQSEAMDED